MANIILFGNHALTEEQFIPIFEQWYIEKKDAFLKDLEIKVIQPLQRVLNISESISKKGKRLFNAQRTNQFNAETIYQAWENITNFYFGNDSVDLLGIVKFEGESFQFTKMINESQYINKSGIAVNKSMLKQLFKDLDQAFVQQNIADILNQHYSEFNKQLNGYQLNRNPEAYAMHLLLESRNSLLKNTPEHFTNKTYGNIIFGSQQNATGKQLDAFMNHVAQYESQILYALKEGKLEGKIVIKNDFPELFSRYNEVQEWLLNSLNSASWLTGGDIIVVDENTGEIKYNIQLKSTMHGKNFNLAFGQLSSFVMTLKDLMSNGINPKELAQYIFKELSTSIANEMPKAEQFYTEKIYEMVAKNLGISENGIKNIGMQLKIT